MAATKKFRPLVVQPSLQDAIYQERVCCLTGSTACIRLVHYGHGKKVTIGTVSGALLDVGKTVALAYEGKPIKSQGENTLVPKLSQTMEGFRKVYPPTKNVFSIGN